MPLYLGLDCGGSSSRTLLIDSESTILYEGQSGPANVATTPRPYLAMSVKRALEGCPKPDYVCGCFGGLVSVHYEESLKRLLEGFAPGAVIRVYPDFYAAFASVMDPNGFVILAGTGSVVISKVNDQIVRSGGGGPLLGDEGSAFSIGRSALKAYVRGPQAKLGEALTEAVPMLFGVSSPREVVARVYHDLNPAARIALLAQTVAKDYEAGEEYAKKIVRHEMKALAELAVRHLQKYHSAEDFKPVYFTGGLWKISTIYQDEFIEEFKRLTPSEGRQFIKASRQPVFGAAVLAKELENEHRKS